MTIRVYVRIYNQQSKNKSWMHLLKINYFDLYNLNLNVIRKITICLVKHD